MMNEYNIDYKYTDNKRVFVYTTYAFSKNEAIRNLKASIRVSDLDKMRLI